MRKIIYLVLTVAIGLLMTTFTTIRPVSAQVDLNAYLGNTITSGEIDGTIGTEWDDAGHYTGVAIDPQGTAEIWTKNDGTYLYIAINFTADSSNPWLAFQLATTGCMDDTADVAIFGDDNLNATGYSDAYFSYPKVYADASQHGVGAMTVGTGNVVTIELKKPLNSADSAGNDIAWSEGSTYDLVIAWDSDGGGSSGGSVSHKDAGPTAKTILINPEVIPEFPGLMFIAVLIAIAIPVIILVRRTVLKPTANIKL